MMQSLTLGRVRDIEIKVHPSFGLVIFWVAAATHFSWDRAWPDPVFPVNEQGESKGWKAVLDAVPYALWWLVIIETVALAAEEAHEPHRTIPRGLVWAQLTLIGLVALTWLFACGAVDWRQIDSVSYPLAEVLRVVTESESRIPGSARRTRSTSEVLPTPEGPETTRGNARVSRWPAASGWTGVIRRSAPARGASRSLP